MNVGTQSLLMPFIGLCLFTSVLGGSIYAATCLAHMRSAVNTSALATQVSTGFAPPLVMLFAWERLLSEAISFNVVLIIWLVFIGISTVLLATKSSQASKVRSYAAGLLLGCCAFFVCAVYLASLD